MPVRTYYCSKCQKVCQAVLPEEAPDLETCGRLLEVRFVSQIETVTYASICRGKLQKVLNITQLLPPE